MAVRKPIISTPSMPHWTLADTHPTQGRTFQRPLSPAEQLFLSTDPIRDADIVRHLQLRLFNPARDASLLSDDNIIRAWVSTKRRYPLAGAIIQRQGRGIGIVAEPKAKDGNGDHSSPASTPTPHFVVQERDLSVLRPREIIFRQVADAAEIQRQIMAIIHGPRPLSDELLVQFYVFREAESEVASKDILHVLVMISHCVADEVASRTLVRCFLDTLARGGGPKPEPTQMLLEDRLAMVVSANELAPAHLRTLSLARQRWRRAVAAVIVQLRLAKGFKGGHTLPCRCTRSVSFGPSVPGLVETSFTQAQSAAVIAKCREHKITFGNASFPLAQVAMIRMLYRRYLCGEISEEEWAYRRRQPFNDSGYVNLRPYLDKGWFERGGGGEFMLSLNYQDYWLPFMTLGDTKGERNTKWATSDDAPPFSDLLTFDRFLHRAKSVKKQSAEFINHPLFLDIEHVLPGIVIQMIKLANRNGNLGEKNAPGLAKPKHKVSNFGNVDLTLPYEYPLPPTNVLSPYSPVASPLKAGYVTPSPPPPFASEDGDMTPTIMLEHQRLHPYPSSGELYVGSATWRKQLKIFVSYDANVFEEEVVREWLDEMREAVLWYLGQYVCNVARL